MSFISTVEMVTNAVEFRAVDPKLFVLASRFLADCQWMPDELEALRKLAGRLDCAPCARAAGVRLALRLRRKNSLRCEASVQPRHNLKDRSCRRAENCVELASGNATSDSCPLWHRRSNGRSGSKAGMAGQVA
jgi:hypothetical protein